MHDLQSAIETIALKKGVRPQAEYIAGKYPIWSLRKTNANYNWWTEAHDVKSFLEGFHPKLDIEKDQLIEGIAGLSSEKPNKRKVKKELKTYLKLCRLLGCVNTPVSLIKGTHPVNTLHPAAQSLFTPTLAKEYLLTDLIRLQGNGRGVSLEADQEEIRQKYDHFTTPEFNLNENLLFALVATYNSASGNFVYGAPLLCDQELRSSYPENTHKLARLYHTRTEKEIRTWRQKSVEEPAERLMEKIASIYEI